MEDFDCLLEEAHARGMRLIMDMVLNLSLIHISWNAQSCSGFSSRGAQPCGAPVCRFPMGGWDQPCCGFSGCGVQPCGAPVCRFPMGGWDQPCCGFSGRGVQPCGAPVCRFPMGGWDQPCCGFSGRGAQSCGCLLYTSSSRYN